MEVLYNQRILFTRIQVGVVDIPNEKIAHTNLYIFVKCMKKYELYHFCCWHVSMKHSLTLIFLTHHPVFYSAFTFSW